MTLKTRLMHTAGAGFGLPATHHLQARGPMVTLDRDTGEGGGGASSDDGPLSEADALSLLEADEDDFGPEDDADDSDGEDDDEPTSRDDDGDEPDEAAADDDDIEDDASDQEAGGDDAPEDDPASEEDAEDAEDEPEAPAIDPPKFWSAEEKAIFAKASPEVQLLIAAKDQAAEKRVYEAKEEAAAARKDASIIGEFKAVIDQQVSRAEEVFQGKWDGVDWAAWARENPQEAFQAKLEFEQDQEALRQLRTTQEATEREERRIFLRDEQAKLKEMGHVLADPERGKAEKAKLVAYAESQGRSAADLAWAGAWELSVLHKAMLWDELQAKAAATPLKPAPAKRPEKAAPAKSQTAATAAPKAPGHVRPSAPAPARRTVIQRRNREVIGRALRTGRQDDALAALEAIGE